MKKTCIGCRALDGNNCELGYKIGMKLRRHIGIREPVPTEECPKPRTYDSYFLYKENLERVGSRGVPQ